MKSKAIIGIVPALTPEDHSFAEMPAYRFEFLKQQYYEPLEALNLLPIAIPATERLSNISDYLGIIDGLLLVGGEDVNPNIYHQDIDKLCTPMIPRRDYFEMDLIKEALIRNLPILGICRGLQILNVAFGGTLYQDLSYCQGASDHSQQGEYNFSKQHSVNIKKNTKLSEILRKEKITTNTGHHRGISKLGEKLVISATADDDIIEAIELEDRDHYCLAVQWHPESWAIDDVSISIFQSFGDAAYKLRNERQKN